MITSQNHGFSVDESTLPANARVTHRSLFDGSNKGSEMTDAPAFSFQGHPEASPGPHDVAPLFDRFIESMRAGAHLRRGCVRYAPTRKIDEEGTRVSVSLTLGGRRFI